VCLKKNNFRLKKKKYIYIVKSQKKGRKKNTKRTDKPLAPFPIPPAMLPTPCASGNGSRGGSLLFFFSFFIYKINEMRKKNQLKKISVFKKQINQKAKTMRKRVKSMQNRVKNAQKRANNTSKCIKNTSKCIKNNQKQPKKQPKNAPENRFFPRDRRKKPLLAAEIILFGRHPNGQISL
jgi:hypothetical protein